LKYAEFVMAHILFTGSQSNNKSPYKKGCCV
jgi:hypothetical protein